MTDASRWNKLLVLLTLLVVPKQAAAQSLRLDDAVRAALENNEKAASAELKVDVAEAALWKARSGYMPTLTFSGTAAQKGYEDSNGRSFSSSGQLTFTQPLLALNTLPLYRQASHSFEAEKYNARETKRQLAFDTAKAFLQVLAAEQVNKAAEQRLEKAKAYLNDASALSAAHLKSSNDATRAMLEVTSAASAVVNSKGAAEKARLQLGLLMNAEVKGELIPPDSLAEVAMHFKQNPATLYKDATERRFDLKALNEIYQAAESGAQEPNYRLIPTLNFQAQFKMNPDPLPRRERWHDETLSLNLTWTIFDAGVRYGDRRSRMAQAESAALDLRLAKRTTSTNIAASVVVLDAAKEALKVAEQGINAARDNISETEILYKQGLARAIELIDANAKRFDAEANLASAKLTMIQAFFDLENAMGVGPLDAAAVTTPGEQSR